ncbi:Uma2 family endonuclease [Deinococcus sp.]|uniref:Uma2 family endonuclease n=1 Tax=Deinococcus sp. TaxID=47478 RepID=UPI003B59CF52
MSDPAFRKMTEEEYFRLEESSPLRHEYVDGFVYAQAGATNNHNLITGNIYVGLFAAARQAGCRVYQSDMRLRVTSPASQRITMYFPDVMVTCEALAGEALNALAPCLLVEVLSKSTEREDKNAKWLDYQTLPSLQAYLLVGGRSRAAAMYRRTPGGWVYEVLEDRVPLPCVDVSLSLDDIYAGVSL